MHRAEGGSCRVTTPEVDTDTHQQRDDLTSGQEVAPLTHTIHGDTLPSRDVNTGQFTTTLFIVGDYPRISAIRSGQNRG